MKLLFAYLLLIAVHRVVSENEEIIESFVKLDTTPGCSAPCGDGSWLATRVCRLRFNSKNILCPDGKRKYVLQDCHIADCPAGQVGPTSSPPLPPMDPLFANLGESTVRILFDLLLKFQLTMQYKSTSQSLVISKICSAGPQQQLTLQRTSSGQSVLIQGALEYTLGGQGEAAVEAFRLKLIELAGYLAKGRVPILQPPPVETTIKPASAVSTAMPVSAA